MRIGDSAVRLQQSRGPRSRQVLTRNTQETCGWWSCRRSTYPLVQPLFVIGSFSCGEMNGQYVEVESIG
jgi:hypothetical protein